MTAEGVSQRGEGRALCSQLVTGWGEKEQVFSTEEGRKKAGGERVRERRELTQELKPKEDRDVNLGQKGDIGRVEKGYEMVM